MLLLQKPFPLDMAPTSIDDQYVGCSNNMHNEVNTVYLPREKNTNSDFNNAWNKARENAKPSIHGLQKVHSMAIYVYTNAEPEIYPDFNRQVRDGRSNYGTTSFQYHSLHFYLTEAIQMLKRNQTTCKTTWGLLHKSRIKTSGINDSAELNEAKTCASRLNWLHKDQARMSRHGFIKPGETNPG